MILPQHLQGAFTCERCGGHLHATDALGGGTSRRRTPRFRLDPPMLLIAIPNHRDKSLAAAMTFFRCISDPIEGLQPPNDADDGNADHGLDQPKSLAIWVKVTMGVGRLCIIWASTPQ